MIYFFLFLALAIGIIITVTSARYTRNFRFEGFCRYAFLFGWYFIGFALVGVATAWGGIVLGVCCGGLVAVLFFQFNKTPFPVIPSFLRGIMCVLPIACALSTPYFWTDYLSHKLLTLSKDVGVSDEVFLNTFADDYGWLSRTIKSGQPIREVHVEWRVEPGRGYKLTLISDLGSNIREDLGKFANNESSLKLALALTYLAARAERIDVTPFFGAG